MRVLLLGATGFIGSALLARLHASGHEVWAVTRRQGPATRRLQPDRWVQLDIARATRPQDWSPYLDGVAAVVNCAGVLQDGARDSTSGVHRDGPAALFAACEAADVRRFIQISAMGADKGELSAFSRSKGEGDQRLKDSGLDWVILRPSVVVGRAAYGGSALFRALASLPFLPRVPDTGELQIIQLDDVAATVCFFLEPAAPGRLELEVAGPERLGFEAVVAAYRRWLGYPPARRAPGGALMPLLYRLGDAASLLGWRPPVRTNARREMVRGAVGDTGPWTQLTGIRPRALSEALAAEPASVQERWFANLYLLKALIFTVFALFWIVTFVISVGPGYGIGKDLMLRAGAGPLAGPSVVAGALADLTIGLGIAWRRTTRLALWAALGLSLFYLVAGTIMTPWLWSEPLGPMTKIFPIMALNLVALAILEDR
jgi:uncharacterized protein YbjT (DUF2867 family)